MFNNFTLSRVEPRAMAEEEEPSIVMVHNPPPPPPQDQQLPNVPLSSQSPHPRIFQPQKAPEKWRVRRRSSAEIRSIEVIEVEVFLNISKYPRSELDDIRSVPSPHTEKMNMSQMIRKDSLESDPSDLSQISESDLSDLSDQSSLSDLSEPDLIARRHSEPAKLDTVRFLVRPGQDKVCSYLSFPTNISPDFNYN